jgi:hypothetical protein
MLHIIPGWGICIPVVNETVYTKHDPRRYQLGRRLGYTAVHHSDRANDRRRCITMNTIEEHTAEK